MRSIRSNLTYANVMASIAVFGVLGGGAFAATQVNKAPKDSVVSKSIRDGKVKSADLRDNGVNASDLANNSVGGGEIEDGAVTGSDLADGTVASADIADDTIASADIGEGAVAGSDLLDGDVSSADLTDNGVTGTDVDEDSLGVVPNSDQLDNFDSREFFRYGSVMPSGITIRGVWGGREYGANNAMIQDYAFPLASAQTLTDADVNFATGGTSGSIGNDDDPTCDGSVNSPSAPAGKVCLYMSPTDLLATTDTAQGTASVSGRRGFSVRGPVNTVGDVEAHGSWAYTTP